MERPPAADRPRSPGAPSARTNGTRIASRGERRHVARARVRAGRVEPVGADEVRVGEAERGGLRVHQLGERRRSRARRRARARRRRCSPTGSAPPRSSSRTVICSPAAQVDALLADRRRARVDARRRPRASRWSSATSTVISFVIDAIAQVRRARRRRRAPRRSRRSRRARRVRAAAAARPPPTQPGTPPPRRQRRRGASAHRRRILSPMKSEVGSTFGFSCREPRDRDARRGRDRRRACRRRARRRRASRAWARVHDVRGLRRRRLGGRPVVLQAGAHEHDHEGRREQERRGRRERPPRTSASAATSRTPPRSPAAAAPPRRPPLAR